MANKDCKWGNMEDKEKQIKEMVKKECGCYIVAQDICVLDRKTCNCDCIDYRKAKRFYDYFISIGYQKINKDSVILTADEFAGLKKYAYEKGSKETAKTLITKIKQALNDVETVISDNSMNTLQPNIGYNMKQVDDLLDEIEKKILDAKIDK